MRGKVARGLLVALVCALPAACIAQAGDATDDDALATETAAETTTHAETPELSGAHATPVAHERLGEARREHATNAGASEQAADSLTVTGIPAVPGPDKPQPAPWQPNGMDSVGGGAGGAGEDPAPAEKPQPAPWTGHHPPPTGPNQSPSDVASTD